MVQTLIISAYVIIVDIFLKAYFPSISEALGPYVGLIITNCIIMGRCEAYAQNNPPFYAFMDGIASGSGYAIVLLIIAFVRELLGFGSLFGFNILGEGWTSWTLMIMPPGAFFMLAIIIWISKNMIDDESEETGGAKAQ
jgi:Na+-transporting NADH:ubiquinone oxidoreductase subunit D